MRIYFEILKIERVLKKSIWAQGCPRKYLEVFSLRKGINPDVVIRSTIFSTWNLLNAAPWLSAVLKWALLLRKKKKWCLEFPELCHLKVWCLCRTDNYSMSLFQLCLGQPKMNPAYLSIYLVVETVRSLDFYWTNSLHFL